MEHGRGDTPSPHQFPCPPSGEHVSGPPESGAVSVVLPPATNQRRRQGAGSRAVMRRWMRRPPESAADRPRRVSQAKAVRGGLPGKAGGRPGGCGCDKECRIRRWRGKSRGNPLPTTLCPGHFRISHLFPTAVFSSSTCNTPPSPLVPSRTCPSSLLVALDSPLSSPRSLRLIPPHPLLDNRSE